MLSYITIYSSLWENSACIIQLYSESQNPDKFVRNYTIISICYVVFTATASAEMYKMFGQNIKHVIFLNFDPDMTSIIWAKVSYLVSVMGSHALMCFPVFTCIQDYDWFKQIELP